MAQLKATTIYGDVTLQTGGKIVNSTDATLELIDTNIKLTGATQVVGTVTADGLTLGANELITLGAQTLKHDGTDFVFDDSVNLGANNLTTTGNINTTKINDKRFNQFWSTDFFFYQYDTPWIAGAIGAGTVSNVNYLSNDHPGIVYLANTAGNNNSGAYQATNSIGYLSGGETTSGIFMLGDGIALDTCNIFLGFMNQIGTNAISYGSYIHIIGTTGNPVTAYAKSINNTGNETIHGTTATLAVSTWYRYEITVNSDKTSINYKITTSPNISTLLDVNITTNLPTSHVTNCAKAWTTLAATPSQYLIYIDYMDMEIDRTLSR